MFALYAENERAIISKQTIVTNETKASLSGTAGTLHGEQFVSPRRTGQGNSADSSPCQRVHHAGLLRQIATARRPRRDDEAGEGHPRKFYPSGHPADTKRK